MLDRGVKADYVGDFSSGEAGDAGTCFSVPEFHLPVVGSREECFAIVGKSDVSYRFGVAVVGTEKLALVVDIP